MPKKEAKKIIHWDDLPDELTAQHISDIFALSRRRVYELFQTHPDHGGIPSFDIGGSRRADKEDVRRWKEALKKQKLLQISP